jgi:DNA methylase
VSLYYEADGIQLWHGDCRDHTDWLTADVLVTDPPYGVAYVDRTGQTVRNDEDFTVAADIIRLAQQQPMAIFANHASLGRTHQAVLAQHERVRVMTWHKTNVNGATGMGNPWLADVEFIVCGVPAWPKRAVSGVVSSRRHTGNPAWQRSNAEAFLHPTQKPVRAMAAVLDALGPGSVADPCAGSGSTLLAARAQGRRAVGVEIEERYCEVIARRLAQGDLFAIEGDVS